MAYDLGPRIGIDGEAEFRNQITKISNGLKTLGSEMKVVTTEFIGQEKSEKALTAQNEVLTKTVTALNSKLDVQKKMLAESAAAYGENDERTQKWQRAVNATQAELNKANAQIRINNQELKSNGKEAQNTGEKFSKMGELGASAAKTVGDSMKAVGATIASVAKAAGTALAAGSAAIGSLAKQSIEAYGEYEQLVGGVETLFGTGGQSLEEYAEAQGKTVSKAKKSYQQLQAAQSTVLKNANNAYRTAGLSANEYMETVTSFSAALINSLDGDTVKAADVADMAITDMADNANKMGSAIETIQSAYQGFAKQNYTMLDNLKLGYGGTKGEMERLLEDASKISGKEFDLSSYADVVEAIHIIQTEMGITGTTAKEASSTIQGSISAMQSAWGNLIAGMADENADMDQLINNLVDSVITMLGNIIPRLEMALSGMGDVITRLAPVIAEKLPGMVETVLPALMTAAVSLIDGLTKGLLTALPILAPVAIDAIGTLVGGLMEMLPDLIGPAVEIISTLGDGLMDALPSLVPVAADTIGTLVGGLMDMLPDLMDAALQIITTLSNDLADVLPQLIPAAVDMIITLVEALTDPDNLMMLVRTALDLILALARGLVHALPKLLEKGPIIIKNLVSALTQAFPEILAAAVDLIATFAMGIVAAIPELVANVVRVPAAIIGGIKDGAKKIGEVGENIIKGLWDGIKGMGDWLGDRISGFFGGIVDGIKDLLGIHSPSRVFAGIGQNMALGLGEGWNDEYSNIKQDIQSGLDFDAGAVAANLSMPGLTASNAAPDLESLLSGVVNGVQTAVTGAGNDFPQSATIVLQTGDGMTVARWLLPDLRAAMRDNPT